MIGDDRHGIIEANDLTHTSYQLRVGVVEIAKPPSERR
jgi:hypothetical protein